MVNRVYIELPVQSTTRNGRPIYAPPKHAIYHFKNNLGRKISVSANVLYGNTNLRTAAKTRSNIYNYFNIAPRNNARANARARYVLTHVLKNRIHNGHMNTGHAAQIRNFATLYKKVLNANNFRPTNNTTRPLVNVIGKRVRGERAANLNQAITNLSTRTGVNRNKIIASVLHHYSNQLSGILNRKTNNRYRLTEGNRNRTRTIGDIKKVLLMFKQRLVSPATIHQTTILNQVNPNNDFNRLLKQYYRNYSSLNATARALNTTSARRKATILQQLRELRHARSRGTGGGGGGGGGGGRGGGGGGGGRGGGGGGRPHPATVTFGNFFVVKPSKKK